MKHLLLILFCALTFACAETKTEKTFIPNSGDIVYLKTSSEFVPATFDKDYLLRVETIVSSKDKQLIDEMNNSGKIIAVKSGTKVRVIESGLATQVRILEGVHENKLVWVDLAWLKPLN